MAKMKSVGQCSLPPDLVCKNNATTNTKIWHTRELLGKVSQHATGKGIRVCIGDTGGTNTSIYANEPVLAKDWTRSRYGWRDVHGHGSHVQGSVAGLSGLSFAPDAEIVIAKTLDDSGSGASSWLADGIVWAADNGCHIYNGSWGSSQPSRDIQDAIRYFYKNGGLICNIAAGNSGHSPGRNTVGWPARMTGDQQPFAIAALKGSSWSALARASFSSVGPEVDAAAPGQNIRSIRAGSRDELTDMSGTSTAAPVMSSVDVCVLQVMLREGWAIPWTVDDWLAFYAKIPNAIIDLGTTGREEFHGIGAVNAVAVLEWLANGSEYEGI